MSAAFATRVLVHVLGASLAILAERTKDDALRILAGSPDAAEPLDVLRQRWSTHTWMERALVDDGVDVGLLVLVLDRPLSPAESDLVELAATGFAADFGQRRRMDRLIVSERMASMGTLAAGVAHEVNNPLAYVKANVEHVLSILRATAGIDPDTIAALEDAHDGTERMRDIVQKLQTFSRSDAVERATVDVERVIDAALAIAGNDIRRRAQLTKVFRHPPPVCANEARIGQVVLNLVLNALQAIPEGASESNTVRIETGLDVSGYVFIDVADTGSGIPAEVIARIFDPFFTTKPVGVGSGLGLAIAHTIVTKAGGRISVESSPGAGSVFRVELPSGLTRDGARRNDEECCSSSSSPTTKSPARFVTSPSNTICVS